jgi:choline dehydrogenase
MAVMLVSTITAPVGATPMTIRPHDDTSDVAQGFSERVRANQDRLAMNVKPRYDFIVCGAGTAGSVVARRLAENPDVTVLLVEAGGDDDSPSVTVANRWLTNLDSEHDWGFKGAPNPRINGRELPFSMGKVLGGGSAINAMVWARGHRSDWNFFAEEADDPAWGYESVLDLYRRIEDWHGAPDPHYRGTGGPVFLQSAPEPSPLAPATVAAARSIGIPTFDSPNGAMLEAPGGAAISDIRSRDGKRESIFRSYTYPYMDRPNLTVLTHALVTRVILSGTRASAVEISYRHTSVVIEADMEVVLSLGTVNTPKVLMLSGIGDEAELKGLGIPVRQNLRGVGQNFQDHLALYSVWQDQIPLPIRNNGSEATIYWTGSDSDTPDVFICQTEAPYASAESVARFGLPNSGWALAGGVARPQSRGRVRLTGAVPNDPILIDANTFAEPDDVKAAIRCVEVCREIGNAAPLRPFVSREVMPGNLKGRDLEEFVRLAATTYWHPCGTAKMGRDDLAVVDGALRVHGIDNLRIADASIMPRITSGNIMAPCVVIGERAAQMLVADHEL